LCFVQLSVSLCVFRAPLPAVQFVAICCQTLHWAVQLPETLPSEYPVCKRFCRRRSPTTAMMQIAKPLAHCHRLAGQLSLSWCCTTPALPAFGRGWVEQGIRADYMLASKATGGLRTPNIRNRDSGVFRRELWVAKETTHTTKVRLKGSISRFYMAQYGICFWRVSRHGVDREGSMAVMRNGRTGRDGHRHTHSPLCGIGSHPPGCPLILAPGISHTLQALYLYWASTGTALVQPHEV
jgi:hypothetical protein